MMQFNKALQKFVISGAVFIFPDFRRKGCLFQKEQSLYNSKATLITSEITTRFAGAGKPNQTGLSKA